MGVRWQHGGNNNPVGTTEEEDMRHHYKQRRRMEVEYDAVVKVSLKKHQGPPEVWESPGPDGSWWDSSQVRVCRHSDGNISGSRLTAQIRGLRAGDDERSLEVKGLVWLEDTS